MLNSRKTAPKDETKANADVNQQSQSDKIESSMNDVIDLDEVFLLDEQVEIVVEDSSNEAAGADDEEEGIQEADGADAEGDESDFLSDEEALEDAEGPDEDSGVEELGTEEEQDEDLADYDDDE